MMIARVVGNIVSTQKHEDYKGQKLMLVRAASLTGELYGPEMVRTPVPASGIWCLSYRRAVLPGRRQDAATTAQSMQA